MEVNLCRGSLGIALTNNYKLGSEVAVMGMYDQGSLYVVHINPQTGKGAYKAADGQGGRARDLAFFENFDYSDKMKAISAEIASTKPGNKLQSKSITQQQTDP